jgi:CRP-like cAMP-binding protein
MGDFMKLTRGNAQTGTRQAAPKAQTHGRLDSIAGVVPAIRHVADGEYLFRQGRATFGIFRLLHGRIRLVRVSADGTEVSMHGVRRGELFAEASLFSARYHCDAVATMDSEVLVYPRAELAQRLHDDREALWAFTGELARRVQGLRSLLELRQTRSAPERVLQFLRLRSDTQGVVRPDDSLKRLAEEVGLTHEAFYRALATLEREGAIKRSPGEIRLNEGAPARAQR